MKLICVSLQARLDHKTGTIHFNNFDVDSDQLRGHIALLASRLTKAVTMIAPAANAQDEQIQREVMIGLLLFCEPFLSDFQCVQVEISQTPFGHLNLQVVLQTVYTGAQLDDQVLHGTQNLKNLHRQRACLNTSADD